jgi:hypothetical protein
MTIILVEQLSKLSPAEARLAESSFVLEKFAEASKASHNETLFLLTAYFDAFLFCYISIEEMVDDAHLKSRIQGIPIFAFFKALRNIATHHCVLAGVQGKFPSPIARIVKIGGRENAVFCVVPDKVEYIFSEIIKIFPRESKTIESARKFLASRVAQGGDILVYELMRAAVESVKGLLPYKSLDTGASKAGADQFSP